MPEIPPPFPELSTISSPGPREGVSSCLTSEGSESSDTHPSPLGNSTLTVRIKYPDQSVFKCPICNTGYSIYSSWTRHLKTHPSEDIKVIFECSGCQKEYDNKKSISNHFTKTHGKASIDRTESPTSGSHLCEFCKQFYPNKRSLSQHIRNQHPAEASDKRDQEASQVQSNNWTPQEHSLFLEALKTLGPSSNKKIAEKIVSKNAKQVATHKRIFLRENPKWLSDSRATAIHGPPLQEHPSNLNPGIKSTFSDTTTDPAQTIPPKGAVSYNRQKDSLNVNASPFLPHLSPNTDLVTNISNNQSEQDTSEVLSSLAGNHQGTSLQAVHYTPPIPPNTESTLGTPTETTPKELSPSGGTWPTQPNNSTDLNNPVPTSPPSNKMQEPHDVDTQHKENRKATVTNSINSIAPFTNKILDEKQWKEFESFVNLLCEELKKSIITRTPKHPTTHWQKRQKNRKQQQTEHPCETSPPEPPTQNKRHHRRQKYNPQAAAKLQKWYRANKKKCINSITEENQSPKCEIPPSTLENHFSHQVPEQSQSPPPPDNLPSHARTSDADELSYPVEPKEVNAQLNRLPTQSAPGPDGIPYYIWKYTEGGETLLSMIFSICLLNKKTPESWKKSITILIHKKGDKNQPENWRPISLQPTIYKIYAAILARRLAGWAILNNKISRAQKGFLPYEGCIEHSFMLRSVLEDSKRRRKNARIVWLDLKNAFGSVPHNTIWDMIRRLDIPTNFQATCEEIYSNATEKIQTKGGLTNDIQITRGIKQGCPLSPLLFNLVLEGIIPLLEETNKGGYRFTGGATVQVLAYADDLCIFGHTKEDIQQKLDKLHKFTEWAGMSFNPSKCGSLSTINNKGRKYVESFQPKLNRDLIPALKWDDHYKYLGIESGRERAGRIKELEERMLGKTTKIMDSLLTDWQKIEAINTFVLTGIEYHMNAALLNRTWLRKLESQIRQVIKKGLKLPRRTISVFLHTPKKYGGLGITSLEDRFDMAQIKRAFLFLTCQDKTLQNVAWSQLTATIKHRRTPGQKEDLSEKDVENFLNSPPGKQEKYTRDVQSLWNLVRKSLKRLNSELVIENSEVSLKVGDIFIEPARRKEALKILSEEAHKRNLTELLKAKDQGKAFHLVCKNPVSSHWIYNGGYTTFAEYRFAIKGRLNLLPTKTVIKRIGRTQINTTCPKCKAEQETLGHILNACTPNAGLMRERHNNILARLIKATPNELGDKFKEQKIPDSPGDMRPDLTIINKQTGQVTIIDVTVPFEKDGEAFNKARIEKQQKYSPLVDWFKTQPYVKKVTLETFIIGALGSWDPQNIETLKALQIGPKYARLFKKLCVSEAIKGSLKIWKSKH